MKAPHIILIVLDAVRYDHLMMNGYHRMTMPGLEVVASRGLRFTQAFSTAPWTIPSHASMFTGRYPVEHQANQSTLRVRQDLPLLAEILRDQAQYRTHIFASNSWFDPQTGLTRGFEQIHGDPVSKNRKIRRRLSHLRQRINRWLSPEHQSSMTRFLVSDMLRVLKTAVTDDKPYFLFANLMDAHLPLRPSRQALQEFVVVDHWARTKEISTPSVEAAHIAQKKSLTAGDFRILSDFYDAALFDLDLALQGLFEAISVPQLDGRVLLIITSDHGENLGEHNLMGHQFCLYDTLIHVPLVLHWPGVVAPGVEDRLVQLTDLYHTILSVAGVNQDVFSVNPELDLLNSDQYEREAIMAEYARPQMSIQTLLRHTDDVSTIRYLDRALFALRTSHYKYICTDGDDPSDELYDMTADPEESQNLAGIHPDIVGRMRKHLLNWRTNLAAGYSGPVGTIVASVDDMDEALVERLRNLGYL